MHINAVGDTRKVRASVLQYTVKPVGIVWVAQFLCIGLGNGRHTVSCDDGRLHKVRAVVKAENLVAACAKAQHVIVELQITLALIFDIMDGEHALRIWETAAVFRLQQQRDESRLPVVAADDVGPEFEIVHRRKDSLAEIGVALAVIGKAVNAAAVEIMLVIDEIDLKLLAAGLEAENTDIFPPPCKRNIKRA